MKRQLLFLSLCLIGLRGAAQLNGNYTIGGATPDYASFSAAVTALTTSGISGPVTFNIRTGTYPEKITIPSITGASEVNRITFQSETGDSSAVILTDTSTASSTNNYTVSLNGADFITFKKLTISRTGIKEYAIVINITGDATHNEFLNNHIAGINTSLSTGASSYKALVYSLDGTFNDSMNVFTGNLFENGSYAMYYYGPGTRDHESGTVITNNIFKDQYSSVLYINYQHGIVISGNEIMTTVYSGTGTLYGIFLNFCAHGLSVSGNKVYLPSGMGLYMNNCDGDTANSVDIFNNFFSVLGGSSYGINIRRGLYNNIYNNSIFVTNLTSVCLYAGVSGKTTIQNNIFANVGTGECVNLFSTEYITKSDFNDFYTTGTVIGYWDSVDVATLSDWQTLTGFDTHSLTADPMFLSAGDLHANSPVINNAGVAIASITVDIDGESRSATTPDIGADEFTPGTIGTASIMFDKFGVHIYPNPAGEQLNVEFSEKNEGPVVARLTDMNGRLVSEQKLAHENTDQKTTFDLHLAEQGVYILQLISKTDIRSTKVTVLHH